MESSELSLTPRHIPPRNPAADGPAVLPAATPSVVQGGEQASLQSRTYRYLPYVFGLWSLAMSLAVMPYYFGGDQVNYRAFYATREGASLSTSFVDYQAMLSTQEPGYFVFVHLFSGWLDKDIAVSILNGIFGYYLGRCLAQIRAHPLVIGILSCNYYLIVLYLAAERLKLGLLFVLISAVHTGFARYVAFAAAGLSHVQTVLLILTRFTARTIESALPLVRGRLRADLLWTPVAVALVMLPLIAMQEHTERKLDWYMSTVSDATSRFVKPAVLAIATIAYARGKRLDAFAMQVPILIGAAIVGGERLVLFGYFVLMYFGLQVRGGLNAGVLLSSLYFMLTGILFLTDAVQYGTGFYWSAPAIIRLFG